MKIALKLLRVGLALWIGGMLMLAAIGKLLDNRHFADVLAQWQLFPTRTLLGLGLVVSLSELLLGAWLVSGWRTTYAAAISVIFHAGYALATSVTLLRGIHLPDCGCFGIFFQHPLEWPMVRGDAILTLVSVVLYALARYEMRSGRTVATTG